MRLISPPDQKRKDSQGRNYKLATIPLEIAIIRHDNAWPEQAEVLAERAIFATLDIVKPHVKGVAELSIVLTNDAEQHKLNWRWRGKDSTTNVLSFPQITPFASLIGLLGDITLARETLEQEAGDLSKSFADHFIHLIVHGFLHILGHDHLADDEAQEMERLETRILASLGIPDPHADYSEFSSDSEELLVTKDKNAVTGTAGTDER